MERFGISLGRRWRRSSDAGVGVLMGTLSSASTVQGVNLMAELRLDEDSRKALEERLKSPEGQKLLNRLARLIAQSAAKHMPADLLRSLDTQEGEAAFRDAWPRSWTHFLFR